MSFLNILGFGAAYLLGSYNGQKEMQQRCVDEVHSMNAQAELLSLKREVLMLKAQLNGTPEPLPEQQFIEAHWEDRII